MEFPKSNYYRVPNDINILLAQLTKSEILTFMYILRHTWGFAYDNPRRPKALCFDDFINGRQTKKGRMDSGCGLQVKSTVSRAVGGLMEKDFILCFEDGSDQARIRRWYRVRMDCDEDLPSLIDVSNRIVPVDHDPIWFGFAPYTNGDVEVGPESLYQPETESFYEPSSPDSAASTTEARVAATQPGVPTAQPRVAQVQPGVPTAQPVHKKETLRKKPKKEGELLPIIINLEPADQSLFDVSPITGPITLNPP